MVELRFKKQNRKKTFFFSLKKNMRVSFILLSFLLISSLTRATTYYVSPNGDDTNDGSQSNPFRTINYALTQVQDGDTIRITSGTYTHEVAGEDLTDITITTNNLTLQGEGADTTVIDFNNSTPAGTFYFSFENVNGAKVEGLSFTNIASQKVAIGISSSTSVTINNNKFYNPQGTDGVGIWISGPASTSVSATIHHNIFYNLQRGITIYDPTTSGPGTIIIKNNTLDTCASGLFAVYTSKDIILKNNIASNMSEAGFIFYYYSGTCTHAYNNGNFYSQGSSPQVGIDSSTEFTLDPRYVDKENGDYHLKTLYQGLYEVHSPSIDTGDPQDSVGSEPEPNGGRINQGAYGGTGEAAQSITKKDIVYVDGTNGSSAGQGTSTDPLDTINRGLSFVNTGGKVIVAPGTYTENVSIPQGVTLESSQGPEVTIIDGGGNDTCVTMSTDSTLKGFTLTNGSSSLGGGVYLSGDNALIENCIIKNNSAEYGGGLLILAGTGIQIKKTIFKDNTASSTGGGGGILIATTSGETSVTISNCILYNNSSQGAGGGIYLFNAGGAGINLTGINNTIYGNSASLGGGIYLNGGGVSITATFKNCIISHSNDYEIYEADSLSDAICINSLLYNPSSSLFYDEGTTPITEISNLNTLEGFSSNLGSDPLFVSTDPDNSDFLKLSSRANGQSANSPAIDSGTSQGAPSTDIAGTARPQGDGVDIGAYEYLPQPSEPDVNETETAFGFTNASYTKDRPVEIYTPNTDSVYINIKHSLKNTAPGSRQTVTVTITSSNTQDEETITLTESGNDTGIFRNTNNLPVSIVLSSVASKGNGKIEASNPDLLTLEYDDPYYDYAIVGTPFSLTKDANKEEASVGEIITYTLRITNNVAQNINNVQVVDDLPVGFKYIEGTASLNGSSINDPQGGRRKIFSLGTINASSTNTLRYKLVVGSGVDPGRYTNTAYCIRSDDSLILSNSASEDVHIIPDPFFSTATIIGRVFIDRNRNGYPDPQEEGLKDVELVTEQGLRVKTDRYGRFHIKNLKPQSHIIAVDTKTLPEGAYLTTENPLLLSPISQGLVVKANFGIYIPEEK